MNRKLLKEEFEEIETLVNNVLSTHTQKDAKSYIMRLEFLSNSMSYDIAPNVRFMFSELVSETKSAAGQVREKEHWVSVAKSLLYKLESFGVEREQENDE